MSEPRTPNAETVKHGWAKGHPFPRTTEAEERYAEFDRWLAETVRAAKADAWDEGQEAGINDDLGDWEVAPSITTNPYLQEADQ